MKTLLTAEQLHEGVDRMAREVTEFYANRPLTIVGVLTGSIVLLADLIRRLTMPLRVGLVQASSYRGTSIDPGQLTINFDLLPDVKGQHVLLVDDIFDTGKTLVALSMNCTSISRPASGAPFCCENMADRRLRRSRNTWGLKFPMRLSWATGSIIKTPTAICPTWRGLRSTKLGKLIDGPGPT